MKYRSIADYALLIAALGVGVVSDWDWFNIGLLLFVAMVILRGPSANRVLAVGVCLFAVIPFILYFREAQRAEELAVASLVAIGCGMALKIKGLWPVKQ